jgi:3-methyl-2-oxobutanoate hydroxymethyltransferase
MDAMSSWPENRRVTVRDLAAAKERGERWPMLTSYDAMTAGIFDDAGIPVLLVGDSAGMVVLGHDTTLEVTLDEMIVFAGAVVRGTKRCMVVGDLPFGSYQVSPQQAIESAVRYVKETGIQVVKLEGGHAVAQQIQAITDAGIPVMAHIGLTPQHVHALGGMRVQGRGEDGERLIAEAKTVESAGAFAVVLEAVPANVAREVTGALDIPVVGIGAGAATDAQVLVWQDMAGLNGGHVPRFVKQYANLRNDLRAAVARFAQEVRGGEFPKSEHGYL